MARMSHPVNFFNDRSSYLSIPPEDISFSAADPKRVVSRKRCWIGALTIVSALYTVVIIGCEGIASAAPPTPGAANCLAKSAGKYL
jgi:hypothetical protein